MTWHFGIIAKVIIYITFFLFLCDILLFLQYEISILGNHYVPLYYWFGFGGFVFEFWLDGLIYLFLFTRNKMYLYEITITPLLAIIFAYYITSKFLHYCIKNYISKMTSHKSEQILFIISIYFLYSFVLYIRKKKYFD